MKRLLLAAALLGAGVLIFVLGNPYYSVWPMNGNKVFYYVLAASFLVAALILRRSSRLHKYWQAAYAFFMASAALLFMSTGFLNARSYLLHPLKDLAVDKLSQFLYVVPLLIVLTLLAGDDLKSIFIRRGNLKRGLIFGISSFGMFALIAWVVQPDLVSVLSSLPNAVPWLLLFVFANAIMEELWFRAIFLKRFESLIGGVGAILVTALVFAASHFNATYSFPGGPYVYAVVVFILGVVGAHAMRKENGLLGAVLFHAGYDLVIVTSILNSM
ncbi:MAG: CPBP family intramembrane metalloprotease [Candidatus Atribacteria bacterium]|nr:MAG: CPBP family intramembrane metalloprotease [Candidatus Atribacteria bacterium]